MTKNLLGYTDEQTYPGGWIPDAPAENYEWRIFYYDDGTAERVEWDTDGNETSRAPADWRPDRTPPPPAADLSGLLATVTEKADANRAIADGGPTSMTRTIARNAADGLDAVAEILTTLTTPT